MCRYCPLPRGRGLLNVKASAKWCGGRAHQFESGLGLDTHPTVRDARDQTDEKNPSLDQRS